MAENGEGPILLDVITYHLGGPPPPTQQTPPPRKGRRLAGHRSADHLSPGADRRRRRHPGEIDAIWAETKQLIGDICHIAADLPSPPMWT